MNSFDLENGPEIISAEQKAIDDHGYEAYLNGFKRISPYKINQKKDGWWKEPTNPHTNQHKIDQEKDGWWNKGYDRAVAEYNVKSKSTQK